MWGGNMVVYFVWDTLSNCFILFSAPNAVDEAKIRTKDLKSTSTTIVWVEPAGNLISYVLTVTPATGVNMDPHAPPKGTTETKLTNLDAGTLYKFTIQTKAGPSSSKTLSAEKKLEFNTRKLPPGVKHFTLNRPRPMCNQFQSAHKFCTSIPPPRLPKWD
jgi:hypothetical protein